MSDAQRKRLYQAIESRDANAVRSILAQSPEIREAPVVGNTWLEQAAGAHEIETVKVLLELGFSINAQSGREGSTPLMGAIESGDAAMTRYLLSCGADPNLSRPLIAAILQDDEAVGLELVQILVRAGADINTFFPWFGDPSKGFTPLGFAEVNQRMDIASYLRIAKNGQPTAQTASSLEQEEQYRVIQWYGVVFVCVVVGVVIAGLWMFCY